MSRPRDFVMPRLGDACSLFGVRASQSPSGSSNSATIMARPFRAEEPGSQPIRGEGVMVWCVAPPQVCWSVGLVSTQDGHLALDVVQKSIEDCPDDYRKLGSVGSAYGQDRAKSTA